MDIFEKLNRLPPGPGVYFMKGSGGTVLYIGKAKSLSDRVRSYFQKGSDLTPRIRHMVELVRDVETMVTASELEALILENNLIKKHRPRYNVVLRDDKNYPYLRLDLGEDYPRPEIVRRVRPDGALYFGPYVPTHALRETLRILRKIFPLPNCNIVIDGKAERACIEFEIKRCLAPCTGQQSREDYREMIRHLRLFLEGKDRELIRILKARMGMHSHRLEFEEAARIRDQVGRIEKTLESQRVTTTRQVDFDVVAMARSGDRADLQVLFVRGGMLTGRKDFFMDPLNEAPDPEILSGFLKQFYNKEIAVPPQIVLPMISSDHEIIQRWLSERRGQSVRLSVPGSEPKKDRARLEAVLKLAEENAAAALEDHLAELHLGAASLDELKEILNLSRRPSRIEAVDISNIMGNQAVGSVVTFEEGQPKKAGYRTFKIRTIRGADDFGMIREVLLRRYAAAETGERPVPDLILIDGGRGQLGSALSALKELGIKDRDVIGLAKEKGEKFERVFLPGHSEPVGLDPISPATHLLQRIRDEAHRFAITHHRKLRSRGMLVSELDGVPGIGDARKKALLRHFGSLEGIRQASVDELRKVRGVTQKLAEQILLALYRESAS